MWRIVLTLSLIHIWSIVTTVTSNGSVNGMHDSTMPLSGMMEMLNMQINTWFGGVGQMQVTLLPVNWFSLSSKDVLSQVKS